MATVAVFTVTVASGTVWDGNVPRVALGNGALGTVAVVTVTVWDGAVNGGLVGSVGEFVLCKSYAVTGTDRNSS